MSEADHAVLDAARHFCRGVGSDYTLRKITELGFLTISRSMNADEVALQRTAFVSRMQDWPEWVIRWFVDEWPKKNKFFPTWDEINRWCKPWMVEVAAICNASEVTEGKAEAVKSPE